MRGQRGIRALPGRLLLAVALGALALLAIPAVGLADHGNHHGNSDPAGTVKSFDQETGVLTIDLAKSGDIEGLVTDRTRIRCENDNDREDQRHNRRHGRRATASDSGPGRDGDNSGPGNSADDPGDHHAEEPGEDNHNQGDEPGEDNHGEPGDDDDNDEHHGRNERCMAQLVAGATVRRAELELENGNAFFEKVVLMPQPEEG